MSARHLYLHVPFCTRRCSYCDFSIAVRRTVPVDDYLRGLKAELARTPPQVVALETVYLGGGTPSRLGSDGIARTLDLVRNSFPVGSDTEITIEANPEDITREAVAAWMASGVNRLSIGVQSFDDRVLQWMHRVHSARDAVQAIEAARDAGISNFSIDLIFALPRELRRSWDADLEKAFELSPPHISLYGLTIEPSTPLARWQSKGTVNPATEDSYAAEFLLAHNMGLARGYDHYEVSNFSLPGMKSRHNSAYWTGVSYIGLGPSAHSFDGDSRWWNVGGYADWLARLDSGLSIVEETERLSENNRASERVYLGLRTAAGLRAEGTDLDEARRWSGAGWAKVEEDVVKLTPEGWLRLDSLAAGLTGF